MGETETAEGGTRVKTQAGDGSGSGSGSIGIEYLIVGVESILGKCTTAKRGPT